MKKVKPLKPVKDITAKPKPGGMYKRIPSQETIMKQIAGMPKSYEYKVALSPGK
jgi:hypothetical protein